MAVTGEGERRLQGAHGGSSGHDALNSSNGNGGSDGGGGGGSPPLALGSVVVPRAKRRERQIPNEFLPKASKRARVFCRAHLLLCAGVGRACVHARACVCLCVCVCACVDHV